MGTIAARPIPRVVVISFLAALSIPSIASAAEIYLGVAPGTQTTTGGPGTLIRANDTTGAGVIVGDAYPSEALTGYGGLAFDASGNLWATVGKDDHGSIGSEDGTLASTLVRINPADGSIVQTVGPVQNANNQSLGIIDLAIQPGSNTLFGVNTTTSIGPQPCDVCVFTIDTSTGIATSLGQPMQGTTRIVLDALAFDPRNGTLYGTGKPAFNSGQTAYLYTINPSTLAISNAEAIARDPNDPYQTTNSARSFGLAVRPSDGTIFGTLCCSDEIVYRYYDIVTETYLWRFLGPTGAINANNFYADLAFAPIPTPVPAAVWLFGSGLAALAGMRRRRSPDGANAGINRRA